MNRSTYHCVMGSISSLGEGSFQNLLKFLTPISEHGEVSNYGKSLKGFLKEGEIKD